MDSNLVIRAVEESDLPFIYATWLRGLYYGNPWFREIDKATYFTKYHETIESMLAVSHVAVACLKDDPEVVVGYSVFEVGPNTLHWVFVKKGWRKLGIAKALVPDGITTVSHLTKIGKAAMPPGWKFNPFVYE